MVRFQIVSALSPLARLPSSKAISKTSLQLQLSSQPGILLRGRCQNQKLHIRMKSTSSNDAASQGNFHTFMTTERFYGLNFAQMCGHASPISGICAFMMTDMLVMRSIFIFGGVVGGVANYYYLPTTNWIALKWGAVFLSVNCFRVGTLMWEQHKAELMPDDDKKLYEDGEFDYRGFTKVCFMKFLDLGTRRRFSEGELISHGDREMDKLYYIIDGEATVKSKDGRHLATIPKNHFVGEMAFLAYTQHLIRDEEAPYAKASANVFASGDKVQVVEWDAGKLAQEFKGNRDVSNAFSTYCSHDLRMKLLAANDSECGSILVVKTK